MVITRENIERAENLLIDLCAGGLEDSATHGFSRGIECALLTQSQAE